MKGPLAPGQPAPPFRAVAQQREVSLEDVRGRMRAAVVFYPLAFTPVCRTEMPELEQVAAEFAAAHCALFAISVDHPSSANAFAQFCGVRSFPVIGDFGKEIVSAYGVLRDEGFAERCTFLIDRSGVIRAVKVSDLMVKRDFRELLPIVETLP